MNGTQRGSRFLFYLFFNIYYDHLTSYNERRGSKDLAIEWNLKINKIPKIKENIRNLKMLINIKIVRHLS